MIKELDEATWLELGLTTPGKTPPECMLGVKDTYFVRNPLNWSTIENLYTHARASAYFGAIWRFFEYYGILHNKHLDRLETASKTGKKFRGRPPVPQSFMGEGMISRRTLSSYKLDLVKKLDLEAEREKKRNELELVKIKEVINPNPDPSINPKLELETEEDYDYIPDEDIPDEVEESEKLLAKTAAFKDALSKITNAPVTTAKLEEPIVPENIEELSKKLAALKQAIKGSNTAVFTATQGQGSLLDIPKIAPPPPPPNPKDQLKDLRSKLLIQRGYGTTQVEAEK